MEIPGPRYPSRDPHAGGLPSILLEAHSPPRGRAIFGGSSRDAFSSPPHYSQGLSSSIPMSIPNAPSHDEPPPPLPPPRYVPIDGPVADRPEPLRHESSGYAWRDPSTYGSLVGSISDERPSYKSRETASMLRARRDEGYSSLSSIRSQDSAVPTRFGIHHEKYQFKSSADAYDNSLLKKFDARKTLENWSPPRLPALTTSVNERMSDRVPMQLKPLSLPTRTKQQSLLESPGRFTETPLHSAVSPRLNPFSHAYTSNQASQGDCRSPSEADLDCSPPRQYRSHRTNSGSVPDDATVFTVDSYGDETDFPTDETSRLRGFHIDERGRERGDCHAAGQKRRASSPLGDEPPLSVQLQHVHGAAPTAGDMLLRRNGPSRGSPTPRLSVIPQSSISSTSSATRSGSYASNLSIAVSSVSSAASYGRRSPGGLSPGGLSPTENVCGSPYGTPASLTTSPRMSITTRSIPHQRNVSAEQNRASLGLRRPMEVPKSTLPRTMLMCECCPKKPKKFDTPEELSAHEAEKQYECSFCGNRFKNKNEAERHQNSLHVRRHSWSCSALSGYDRAFHESTARPGEADSCGYCGEDFSRSGGGAGQQQQRHATDADWDERIRHLQDVHKFRECNSSKKFYRADHFRQHLKHSHAGTSGKWTNMLENACMMDEESPIPSR